MPRLPRLCLVAAFVVVGAGASASRARADDLSFDLPELGRTTFQLTSTSLLRFRGDNYETLGPRGDPTSPLYDPSYVDPSTLDDDFLSFYQRFDLSLQAEHLRLEMRFDTFLPFVDYAFGGDTEVRFGAFSGLTDRTFTDANGQEQVEARCPSGILEDNSCYLRWDARFERIALRWNPNAEWNIEVGDTQLVFGRGVALSFRKVDLLGVDNALRGGHVRFDGHGFQFRLHAGLANPQNQDPLDLSIISEPTDAVIAGSVGANLPGSVPLTTTVHAVRVAFGDSDLTVETDRAVDVAGWTVEAPALADGALALYFEANAMRRQQTFFDERDTSFGRGVYGSLQLQLDNVTLLAEWKDYSNFLVAPTILEGQPWRIYNAAPAVEYDGPQRLRGIGNQRGGGLRFDYAFLPGPWSFALNTVAYGFNEEIGLQEDPFDGVIVTHSWARLARRQEYGDDINWGFNVDFGARFEVLNHELVTFGRTFQPGEIDRWMIHGRAEVAIGSGDHSIDVVVDHRHERDILGSDTRDFQIGGVSLTYSYGIPLALSLGLRWTDFQESIVDQRAERGYNFFGGLFYPSLEVRWTFEPGTFVNVFVGQTPGGQICSGGVCRDVPTYEGFRVQFVGRL